GDITNEQIAFVNELFDAMDSLDESKSSKNRDKNSSDSDEMSDSEIVLQLNDILSDEITDKLSDIVLLDLVKADAKVRNKAKKTFIEALETVYADGVRSDNKETAKEEMKSTLKYSSIEDNLQNAFEKIADFAIVENSF